MTTTTIFLPAFLLCQPLVATGTCVLGANTRGSESRDKGAARQDLPPVKPLPLEPCMRAVLPSGCTSTISRAPLPKTNKPSSSSGIIDLYIYIYILKCHGSCSTLYLPRARAALVHAHTTDTRDDDDTSSSQCPSHRLTSDHHSAGLASISGVILVATHMASSSDVVQARGGHA
jgi:hypothetical protein